MKSRFVKNDNNIVEVLEEEVPMLDAEGNDLYETLDTETDCYDPDETEFEKMCEARNEEFLAYGVGFMGDCEDMRNYSL